MGTNLIELGYIDLDELSRALGKHHDLPAALARHFQRADLDLQRQLPAQLADRHSFVPILRLADGKVAGAAMDPEMQQRVSRGGQCAARMRHRNGVEVVARQRYGIRATVNRRGVGEIAATTIGPIFEAVLQGVVLVEGLGRALDQARRQIDTGFGLPRRRRGRRRNGRAGCRRCRAACRRRRCCPRRARVGAAPGSSSRCPRGTGCTCRRTRACRTRPSAAWCGPPRWCRRTSAAPWCPASSRRLPCPRNPAAGRCRRESGSGSTTRRASRT